MMTTSAPVRPVPRRSSALFKARYAVAGALVAAAIGSGGVAIHLAHAQAAIASAASERRSVPVTAPAVAPTVPAQPAAPSSTKPSARSKAKPTPSAAFTPVAPVAPAGSGGSGGGTTGGS